MSRRRSRRRRKTVEAKLPQRDLPSVALVQPSMNPRRPFLTAESAPLVELHRLAHRKYFGEW
jgi:hypothetical protein